MNAGDSGISEIRAEFPAELRAMARDIVTDPAMNYDNIEGQAADRIVEEYLTAEIADALSKSIKTLSAPPTRKLTKVCRIYVRVGAVDAIKNLPLRVQERVLAQVLQNIFSRHFLAAVREIVGDPYEAPTIDVCPREDPVHIPGSEFGEDPSDEKAPSVSTYKIVEESSEEDTGQIYFEFA